MEDQDFKSSRIKATPTQLQFMVDFMKDNHQIASGRCKDHKGRANSERQWLKLTKKLNSLRGSVKPVVRWKQTWRDLRNTVKKKTQNKTNPIKYEGEEQEGSDSVSTELTDLDRAVISVLEACTVPADEEPQDCIASDTPILSLPKLEQLSSYDNDDDADDDDNPLGDYSAKSTTRPRTRRKRRISTCDEPLDVDNQIMMFESERLKLQKRHISVEEKKLELQQKQLYIDEAKVKALERIATALERNNSLMSRAELDPLTVTMHKDIF